MTPANARAHVAAELSRGEKSLQAAEALLALGLFSDAVSRAYYAAFHHACALLLVEGAEPRTHAGVRGHRAFVTPPPRNPHPRPLSPGGRGELSGGTQPSRKMK